jgi:AraC-like DNA-binding protein
MDAADQIAFVDIRMDGVTFSRVGGRAPFLASGVSGAVSLCYLVRRGTLWLETRSPRVTLWRLDQGAIVGFSGLIPHWLKSEETAAVAGAVPLKGGPLIAGRRDGADIELLVGQAPIAPLAESSLLVGPIVIPPRGGRLWRRVWRAMRAAEDELTDAAPVAGREAALRRCAELMLLNIVRWRVTQAAPGEMDVLGALGDQRVMRALAAAAGDPMGDWTVARMARVAGMSRTAFSERFHRLTGASPLQSVLQARLRLAAEDLIHTRHSVEAIAERAGYGSSAAFVRAFQRVYGQPPARWRAGQVRALDDRSIFANAR